MVSGIDSFPLLAVPFFILAGNLMNNAGITTRIYNFALALVGWLKGGLGHVNVRRLGDLRRHERHRDRRRRRPRHDRDQGDEGARLLDRVRGRRDGRLGHARADHPAEPALRDLRDDGQRLGRRAVPRRHPAGRADGGADDAHGRLLRAQEQVGRATSSSRARGFVKALGELGGGRSAGRCCCGWWSRKLGAPAQLSVFVGLALLFVLDRIFSFEALLPIMTPVLLIGGMTTGLFTPTEGAIAACVWAMILGFAWYRTLDVEDVRQGLPRHRRDHRHRALHRRRRVDLRLDADGHRRHRRHRRLGARLHQGGLGLPAAGQPADAVRRLLPGADRGDHDPGADPAADRRRSSASTRSTSAW